jgi:hypothetical protein
VRARERDLRPATGASPGHATSVVEILPACFELRGGSSEESVALFERACQASRSAIVMDDPKPFECGRQTRGRSRDCPRTTRLTRTIF